MTEQLSHEKQWFFLENPASTQANSLSYVKIKPNDEKLIVIAGIPTPEEMLDGAFIKICVTYPHARKLVGWVNFVALRAVGVELSPGQLVEFRKAHDCFFYRSSRRVTIEFDEKAIFSFRRLWGDDYWYVFLTRHGLVETVECFVRTLS